MVLRAAALTVAWAQWSCVSTQTTAKTAESAPSPPGPSEAAPPPAKLATIAEASAACDQVQANVRIPVSCTTDYVDDVPSMIVGFRTAREAEEWLGPFAEHVGNPFCDAANRSGREARVYMTVGTGPAQQARRWSCELGKWSDWFATAPEPPAAEPRPAPTETIADAITACGHVQANREVPVTCHTEYVDGVASMIVGFPTTADAEKYMDAVAEQVAAPFCNAANSANRRASLFITLARAKARHYDCEQQRWGEWFELSQPRAVDRSSL